MKLFQGKWKKILLYIVGGYIIFKVLLPQFFSPIKNLLRSFGFNIANGNDVSAGSGGVVNEGNRDQVCQDVAAKCQVAIWNFRLSFFIWVFNWFEDEDAVIANLNRLNNATEARQASIYYAQLTNGFGGNQKSLKDDVFAKLEPEDRAKIKAVVLNNLTS